MKRKNKDKGLTPNQFIFFVVASILVPGLISVYIDFNIWKHIHPNIEWYYYFFD